MKNRRTIKIVVNRLTLCVLVVTLAPQQAGAELPTVKSMLTYKGATKADDRVLVKLRPGHDVAKFQTKHGALGVERLGQGRSEWKLMHVPQGQADAFRNKLAADEDVLAVEPDYIYSSALAANDYWITNSWQYHINKIQAPMAWDFTCGLNTRTIAILDTGVEATNTDLSGKVLPGYDYHNNDNDPADDNGHGTHVAGLAGAYGNNWWGGAGVDWNARILPVKVLGADNRGYVSNFINGLYYAVSNNAQVINFSLGSYGYSQAFQDAIDYAWGQNRLIVAAAGNDNSASLFYPAAYNRVLSVAATDAQDQKASFSNYGTWIKLAAPGVDIVSTVPVNSGKHMSGTSMSAPIVAGVASLVWSKNTALSNEQIYNRLLTTADITPSTGTAVSNGRVNAYKAMNGITSIMPLTTSSGTTTASKP